jgi:hypothetical protein
MPTPDAGLSGYCVDLSINIELQRLASQVRKSVLCKQSESLEGVALIYPRRRNVKAISGYYRPKQV